MYQLDVSHSQYQDQNVGLKLKPLILEMHHPIEYVMGETSIPNINSLASTRCQEGESQGY